MHQIQSLCFFPVHAEFMLVPARGNVRVAAGKHIRIHADGGFRRLSAFLDDASGLFGQDFEFRFRFRVEQKYPGTAEEAARVVERSEEHTSELQSRLHLVCRLLLEKKKTCTYELV